MKYLPLLLCLVGCAQADPYARPHMWQPDGANSRNLAAMVANPSDLVQGRSDSTMPGTRAAIAIMRLESGRPTPLLELNSDATPGAGKAAAAPPSVPDAR
jgi:type IV pilus biogenesis protein CpaD/CtpE